MVKIVYISGVSALVKEALLQSLRSRSDIAVSETAEVYDIAVLQGNAPIKAGSAIIIDPAELPGNIRIIAQLRRPFRLGELIKLLTDALENPSYASVRLSPELMLEQDPPRLIETSRNRTLELTAKEAELLALLHAAGHEGMDRNDLLHRIWGYGPDIETHTLETHLTRVRRKLEEAGAKECEIIGQQQRYRLICSGNS